jgi:ABC-type antimicrobial peptide transport system permease subunit
MRTFRSPLFNWIAQHPGNAALVLVGVLILLLALLPILLYLVPIRKVPLRYNLRNLQNRWKTTLVTALAFTLVAALLTVMLGFLKGMDIITQGTGHPGNVMVMSDGAVDEVGSNLPKFSPELLPSEIQQGIVKTAEGEYLFSQEVYVVITYTLPNPQPGDRKRRYMQVRGLDKPQIAAAIHEMELFSGRWPSASGVSMLEGQDTAPEAVIGHGVARRLGLDLGKEIIEPGDLIQLGPRKWIVCGVMKDSNSTFNSEIWTRDQPIQEYFGRNNSYTSYSLRTENEAMANLAVRLLKEFRSERNVQPFTELSYYAKLSETSQQFSGAVYFIAMIMALGGVLGIMNTMFAAISQRGKDIGVLRLMGYRRWQILLSFQLESLLIALMGGVVGCLLAYLLFDGRTASSVVTNSHGGGKGIVLKLTFDLGVVCAGMLFTLIMGAIGGLVPSVHAMRLRPLESLK